MLWIMATVFPVLSISSWSALDDGEGILANAATHKIELITWTLLNLWGQSPPPAGISRSMKSRGE